MSDRISIFIDGSNLDRAVYHSFNKRVRIESLAKKLTGERRLMKTYYYESSLLPEVNRAFFDEQQRFFERLRYEPHIEIRLGRRVERRRRFLCAKCGKENLEKTWEQKGVDTLMVFDLVTLAMRDTYDIALVVTGDQDFILPFLEVRMLGKIVENAFTESAWASSLREIADRTITLNKEFLSDCWQK